MKECSEQRGVNLANDMCPGRATIRERKENIMRTKLFAMLAALSIATLGITSCGGGGGSTSTGTQVASKGVITGFGSVYVNGVKYDTTSSGIIIDDSSATSDRLKVGMVVKMKGILNDDGVTGSASSIEYEDSLEGPVNLTATGFSVLGQNVVVTATTVFEGVANLAALTNGQVVEVSGLSNPDGSITATRIEVKSSTEYKVRGTVSNLNLGAGTFTLTVTPTLTFTVNYATATIVPSAAALVNGAHVKVKATTAPSGATITATKVAVKQSGLEDSARAEIEGMVANFDSTLKTFTINGTTVNAFWITLPAGFGNGTRVEVKGPLSNGVLAAAKLETEKDSDQDVQGTVSAKTATTLTVNNIVITVTATTMYEDSSSRHDRMLSFASIAVNDTVEVKGYLENIGSLIATRIERK